jgi:hypothetical protein
MAGFIPDDRQYEQVSRCGSRSRRRILLQAIYSTLQWLPELQYDSPTHFSGISDTRLDELGPWSRKCDVHNHCFCRSMNYLKALLFSFISIRSSNHLDIPFRPYQESRRIAKCMNSRFCCFRQCLLVAESGSVA